MIRSFSRRDLLAASAGALTTSAGCLHRDTADVDSRFAGEPCPPFEADDGDVDEVRCYHGSGTAPDVYLEPSSEVGNPADDSMEFTLYNDSGDDVETNYSSWTLRKQTEEGWMTLPPYTSTHELNILVSGDSRTMPLDMTALDETDDEPGVSALTSNTGPIRYTGPGRYSFSLSATESGLVGERRVRYDVLFEVEGEPLEIRRRREYQEPTDEVARVDLPLADDEDRRDRLLRVKEAAEPSTETEDLPLEIAVQSDLVNDASALHGEGFEEVKFTGGVGVLRTMELHEEVAMLAEQATGSRYFAFETDDGPAGQNMLYRFDDTTYLVTTEPLDD